jgi:hypothetical protein
MAHAIAYDLTPQVSVSMHQYGAVFFHMEHGRLFAVNQTGAAIWRGLAERHSAEHIAEDLCRTYRISLEKARTHTGRFIAQLEGQQLIAQRLG